MIPLLGERYRFVDTPCRVRPTHFGAQATIYRLRPSRLVSAHKLVTYPTWRISTLIGSHLLEVMMAGLIRKFPRSDRSLSVEHAHSIPNADGNGACAVPPHHCSKSVISLTPAFRLYAKHRRKKLAAQEPVATQKRELLKLIERAKIRAWTRSRVQVDPQCFRFPESGSPSAL